eukprot:6188147-Pleurochrysis_carterae.AAC.3
MTEASAAQDGETAQNGTASDEDTSHKIGRPNVPAEGIDIEAGSGATQEGVKGSGACAKPAEEALAAAATDFIKQAKDSLRAPSVVNAGVRKGQPLDAPAEPACPPIHSFKKLKLGALSRLRLVLAVLSLGVSLLLSALGYVPLLHSAAAAAFLQVGCGCLTLEQALNAIDFRVLLTISASFGLGSAIENTHVSSLLGAALSALEPYLGIVPFLAVLFSLTALTSCVVSNAATVVLLYSVVRDMRIEGLRISQPMLVLMLGASSAFATPIGYQTNLMVQSAGKYRFTDFTRLGAPLMIVMCIVVSIVVGNMPESLLP